MTTAPHAAPRAVATPRDTTDAEDIQLLADAIVALAQTPTYDDMTWAEFDAAVRLASLQVKNIWAENGTLAPVP